MNSVEPTQSKTWPSRVRHRGHRLARASTRSARRRASGNESTLSVSSALSVPGGGSSPNRRRRSNLRTGFMRKGTEHQPCPCKSAQRQPLERSTGCALQSRLTRKACKLHDGRLASHPPLRLKTPSSTLWRTPVAAPLLNSSPGESPL